MVSTSIIVLKIPVGGGITDGLDPDRDRVNAIDLDWIDVGRAERTYGC